MSKLNLDLSEEMAELTTLKLWATVIAVFLAALGAAVLLAIAAGWIGEKVMGL
jgi:hypothetical protein